MKISVDNNNIIIRREGILWCLDPLISDFQKGLYGFLKTQTSNFDISLKICLLGWQQELDEFPTKKFITSNNIQNRGRFITPVVECVFSNLNEKDYDLLIIYNDLPLDFDDWQDELNFKFNKIYLLNFKELKTKTQEQWENELRDLIFDFKIGEINLSFENCIPYEFPKEFKLNINQKSLLLTNKLDICKSNIELKICSGNRNIEIFMNHDDGKNTKLNFRNSKPEPILFENEFGKDQAKLFVESVCDYKNENYVHECPLCQTKHEFTNAFICNKIKDSKRLFANESIIFKEINDLMDSDSKNVLFKYMDGRIYWSIINKSVIPITNKNFIIIPENDKIYYIQDINFLEFSEFEKIHKGLYYYKMDKNLYIFILKR